MTTARIFRVRRPLAAAAVVVVAAVLAAGSSAASVRASSPWTDVLVSGTSGSLPQVQRAVLAVGGQVRSSLRVIDGVSARVPAAELDRLRAADGVRAVSIDARGHLDS